MKSATKKQPKKESQDKSRLIAQKLALIHHKRRPGPLSADAPVAPEQELAHIALMLELVDQGALRTDQPNVLPGGLGQTHASHSKRLTLEMENELARRVQTWGDIDARNVLVAANLGLVHMVANQFNRPMVRYEDLAQEGTMGLIRATETFEPDRGVRFSTYSVYWIRAKIQRFLQKLDKDDVPGIIGAEWEINETGKKRKPRARRLSLDRMAEDDDSRSLEEVIPSDVNDPEIFALDHEKRQLVHDVLHEIVKQEDDERLNVIIERRILTEEPETLSQVGRRLDLSREGARLLEAKMMKMARDRLWVLLKQE